MSKGEDLVTLKLLAPNAKPPQQSNIILKNDHNAYGLVGSVTIAHAEKSFRSAGESLKLRIGDQIKVDLSCSFAAISSRSNNLDIFGFIDINGCDPNGICSLI